MAVGKLYMIDLSPPVRAVLLTEKALGINLEHKELNLLGGEHLKADYVKMNPQHTVPSYMDQDGSVIGDSHAIMAYLVGKYGKDDSLYPKDLYSRSVVDQRLHFDSGSLFPLLKTCVLGFTRKGWTSISDDIIEQVKTSYDFLNKFLQGEKFVAGPKVTIADFSCLTSVTALGLIIPLDEKLYPNIASWLKRCEEWPFFSAHSEGFAKAKVVYGSFTKNSS